MNFYKLICIITIVLLIACLTAIGVAIHASSKKVIFPPNISDCPDFYVRRYNKNKKKGKCEATFPLPTKDSGCNGRSFSADKFNNPGMGPTSGICMKKKWARNCKVNWDGITNNSSVCYQTND
tara:strand:- start:1017 stop:1385 length:369 start_codon:yes stop_codon:yes gene_type:complete